MALKDLPILRLQFQNQLELVQNFNIGVFEFTLVGEDLTLDIVRYESKGVFCIHLVVIGIDTEWDCGTFSNFDFVYFVWQHFDEFGFQKYELVLRPSLFPFAPPRRLYLKHYKAESAGWNGTFVVSPVAMSSVMPHVLTRDVWHRHPVSVISADESLPRFSPRLPT